jgi:preprotein translocase subunit SecA
MLRRIEEWAGGLSIMESQIVQTGLDERLVFEGLRPAFAVSEPEKDEELESEAAQKAKVGRNDPCPCGSGKKYKKCCGQ